MDCDFCFDLPNRTCTYPHRAKGNQARSEKNPQTFSPATAAATAPQQQQFQNENMNEQDEANAIFKDNEKSRTICINIFLNNLINCHF